MRVSPFRTSIRSPLRMGAWQVPLRGAALCGHAVPVQGRPYSSCSQCPRGMEPLPCPPGRPLWLIPLVCWGGGPPCKDLRGARAPWRSAVSAPGQGGAQRWKRHQQGFRPRTDNSVCFLCSPLHFPDSPSYSSASAAIRVSLSGSHLPFVHQFSDWLRR